MNSLLGGRKNMSATLQSLERDMSEKQEALIIHTTKEYSIFKQMPGNRPLSEKHVLNLMKLLSRRNLLMCRPITVDENYVVFDGQHRLEAAKRLDLSICYVTVPGIKHTDAGMLNSCTDDWDFNEYLNFYTVKGHEEYVKLNEFIKNHNMTIARFYYMSSIEQKELFDEFFKLGEFFIYDDLNSYIEKIKKIDEICVTINQLIADGSFVFTDNFFKACFILISVKDFSMERFIEKAKIKSTMFVKKTGYKDYAYILSEIYNLKCKKSRVKVDVD